MLFSGTLQDEGTQQDGDSPLGLLDNDVQEILQDAETPQRERKTEEPHRLQIAIERTPTNDFPTFNESRAARANSKHKAAARRVFAGQEIVYSEQVVSNYTDKTCKEVKNIIEIRLEEFVNAYTRQLKTDLILIVAIDALNRDIFFPPVCIGMTKDTLLRIQLSNRILGHDRDARESMLNNIIALERQHWVDIRATFIRVKEEELERARETTDEIFRQDQLSWVKTNFKDLDFPHRNRLASATYAAAFLVQKMSFYRYKYFEQIPKKTPYISRLLRAYADSLGLQSGGQPAPLVLKFTSVPEALTYLPEDEPELGTSLTQVEGEHERSDGDVSNEGAPYSPTRAEQSASDTETELDDATETATADSEPRGPTTSAVTVRTADRLITQESTPIYVRRSVADILADSESANFTDPQFKTVNFDKKVQNMCVHNFPCTNASCPHDHQLDTGFYYRLSRMEQTGELRSYIIDAAMRNRNRKYTKHHYNLMKFMDRMRVQMGTGGHQSRSGDTQSQDRRDHRAGRTLPSPSTHDAVATASSSKDKLVSVDLIEELVSRAVNAVLDTRLPRESAGRHRDTRRDSLQDRSAARSRSRDHPQERPRSQTRYTPATRGAHTPRRPSIRPPGQNNRVMAYFVSDSTPSLPGSLSQHNLSLHIGAAYGSRERQPRRRTPNWMRAPGSTSFSIGIKNISFNNLSRYLPSIAEQEILTLGLSFIPTPDDMTDEEFGNSINEFKKSVRTKYFFRNQERFEPTATEKLKMKLRRNSTTAWIPPLASSHLEYYLERAEQCIIDSLSRCPYRKAHLPSALATGLYSLKYNNEIIIKPADKNLGPTIMDRDWYTREALGAKQLGDTATYELQTTPPQLQLLYDKLIGILQEHDVYKGVKDEMTPLAKCLLDTMLNDTARTCIIYFLPKIHKDPVGLRPICSSINWVTFAASNYLDIVLQETMKSFDSFIQDSISLVLTLETLKVPTGCILLEADVENLYPSIDIEDGINMLRKALIRQAKPEDEISLIVALAEWVLRNNYLEFGDDVFLQLKGTAMGTPFAVAFACIYLSMLELEIHEELCRYNTFPLPIVYKRYIDDVFAVFHSRRAASTYMDMFNSLRKGIRLTFKISEYAVNFLDLTIMKGIRTQTLNLLEIKLHQKEVNKFLFIPPSSFHQPSVFKSWVTGYLHRIRLNCTHDYHFEEYSSMFKIQLQDRGYTSDLIDPIFDTPLVRSQLLLNRKLAKLKIQKNYNKPLVFKAIYTPRTEAIKERLSEALKIPRRTNDFEPELHYMLGDRDKPILCFKRAKNLGDTLVTSKLSSAR